MLQSSFLVVCKANERVINLLLSVLKWQLIVSEIKWMLKHNHRLCHSVFAVISIFINFPENKTGSSADFGIPHHGLVCWGSSPRDETTLLVMVFWLWKACVVTLSIKILNQNYWLGDERSWNHWYRMEAYSATRRLVLCSSSSSVILKWVETKMHLVSFCVKARQSITDVLCPDHFLLLWLGITCFPMQGCEEPMSHKFSVHPSWSRWRMTWSQHLEAGHY